MIRKMLYKSERNGGGYTVSLTKPEGSYQVRWRLIAEEGMAITNGETTVTGRHPVMGAFSISKKKERYSS